jgi:AraC family transcriptional regulator
MEIELRARPNPSYGKKNPERIQEFVGSPLSRTRGYILLTRRTAMTHRETAIRAKEFIERHVRENLTLKDIASRVFMSPFHFQRVFKKETGETPKEYLTRLRMERACHMLFVDEEMSLYEIALDNGFTSQSVFARAFAQKYGMSATAFRKLGIPAIAKLSVWDPVIQQLFIARIRKTFTPGRRKAFLASISVTRVEPMSVIYSPTTMKSAKQIAGEFQALANRATAFDLVPEDPEYFGLMLDFPLHSALDKCRYKACLRVADDLPVPARTHTMKIGGGKYAVFPVKGDVETMIRLAILFFNDWLKERQYIISDLYWFERFPDLPTVRTYPTTVREVYIPIRPAGSSPR